jgi:lipopolysaccharide transport system ATP-binding protein
MQRSDFWALKDLTFEVQCGEVFGVIGRNGAGKSTLLKILSRIVEPTTGCATLAGRVGSLLEVGTGFHPELSGRENVYLNGAVLGLRRKEIDARFDEIVAFSEVESFLDTPVKRYSSGMRVRLAFAVAAHLEPEILIVDEVLAVGDAAFQAKSLGKMDEVSRSGRTVLLVSHNMTAINRMCDRTLYLEGGTLGFVGATPDAINRYLGNGVTHAVGDPDLRDWPYRRGTGNVRIVEARLLGDDLKPTGSFTRLRPMVLEFAVAGTSKSPLNLSAVCSTTGGIRVLQLDHHDSPGFKADFAGGQRVIHARIASVPLQGGTYEWTIGVHTLDMRPVDVVSQVLPFSVTDDMRLNPRPHPTSNVNALCSVAAEWDVAS